MPVADGDYKKRLAARKSQMKRPSGAAATSARINAQASGAVGKAAIEGIGGAGVAKVAGPVNKSAYMLASRAVRGWAKKRGIDPIKATKALSETMREAIDEVDYRMFHGYTKPSAHITPTLKGIADRVSTGNRSGRTLGKTSTSYQTRKGYALDRFGINLGAELGQRSSTVLRPKPSVVFSRKKG